MILGSSPTRPIEHVPLLGPREHFTRVVDERISRDRVDVCPKLELTCASSGLFSSCVLLVVVEGLLQTSPH